MNDSSEPRRDPLMLRAGCAIFRRWSRDLPEPESLDEVHVLNPDEQDQLRRIERSALWKAAGAGALSALICAFSWPLAVWAFGEPDMGSTWYQQWRWYAIMLGVMTIATIIEIVLIYWNALHAVHRMSRAAGLPLFNHDGAPKAVMNAMVAAALELPNSREETLFAVPGREISKWWIVLVALLYRLKVTFSYYLAKAIVQRFLGRVVVRWAIELVAIPIYAFWDALITYWVLRQARVCAMGPSAVAELSSQIQAQNVNLSEEAQVSIVCAVGATVARNSELHPNVELLFRELVAVYGIPEDQDIDNSESLLEQLRRLDQEEQRIVLETLTLSLIIDGHASLWERRLLKNCLVACGYREDLMPLKHGVKSFRNGEPIRLDRLIPSEVA